MLTKEGDFKDEETPWNHDKIGALPETNQEFEDRIKTVIRDLKELNRQNPDKTFLYISHGHVLRKLLGLTTNQGKKTDLCQAQNLSLSIVDFTTTHNEQLGNDYIDVKLQGYNM
jgi:broad specificity phosphatase PhoE